MTRDRTNVADFCCPNGMDPPPLGHLEVATMSSGMVEPPPHRGLPPSGQECMHSPKMSTINAEPAAINKVPNLVIVNTQTRGLGSV